MAERVRLDGRGRLALPADVRRRLAVSPGELVVLDEAEGGGLRVRSLRAVAEALRGSVRHPGESLVDELIAGRRAAAARDAADGAYAGGAGDDADTACDALTTAQADTT